MLILVGDLEEPSLVQVNVFNANYTENPGITADAGWHLHVFRPHVEFLLLISEN